MAKVNYIRLPEPGTGKIRGIGSNMSREFFLGARCPDEWGGGVIKSMTEDPSRGPGVIVIRKSTRFTMPPVEGIDMDFDAICVRAAQWTIVDEKEEPAKPVQQQQGQQRR